MYLVAFCGPCLKKPLCKKLVEVFNMVSPDEAGAIMNNLESNLAVEVSRIVLERRRIY